MAEGVTPTPGGRRSTRLLVFAVLGAVLAGGAAALLKPDPPPVGSPGNLRIPARDTGPVDALDLQQRLLEQLVLDSAVHPDPGRLPAITTFTSFVAQRPDDFDWVLQRLDADDVPPALLVAFAERLPRGRARHDRTADRLLGPLLISGTPSARWAALGTLRSRGRVRFATSPQCRCGFGIHPADPRPGDSITAFAFGATERIGLAWSPSALPGGGWLLDVRGDPEGKSILAFSVEPTPSIRLVAHAPPSQEVVVTVSETR